MTIDAHLHIWRATSTYPNRSATHVSPYSDVPLELLREYMDEYGIVGAVLVQPLFPGSDNSYVADCAMREPKNFAAVCVVDPRLPDAAQKLRYWVEERGCKGIRLRPRLAGEQSAFGDPCTFPLWERAVVSNAVVSVLANPEHLPILDTLADRFPEATIVVDHYAHPDVSAGVDATEFQNLLALARFPNVYVKATGYYYFSREKYPWQDCWQYARAVYEAFGARRMLWGSDFPHILLAAGYRRNLLLQERYFTYMTGAEREQMMHHNAARLYFGKSAQGSC
ncbi:MAG: amidohydrolase [Anaerolineae bacterium]|nr:amidohydrolase [Anaerolineae bacterium]